MKLQEANHQRDHLSSITCPGGECSIQSWLEDTLHPVLAGVVPHPILAGRDIPSCPDRGYPILWYPQEMTWGQSPGTPKKDLGSVKLLWDGDGVPHERTWDQWKYYEMEIGYPSPRKDMGPVEVLWHGDEVPLPKEVVPVEVLGDGDGVSPVNRQTPMKT